MSRMRAAMMLLATMLLLQACVVSRAPLRDVGNSRAIALTNVKTVRAPMLLARPIVRMALRGEEEAAELRMIVRGIKKVQVMTGNAVGDINHGRLASFAMADGMQPWVTVRQRDKMVTVSAEEKNNFIRRFRVLVAQNNSRFVYAKIACKLDVDAFSRLVSGAIADSINTGSKKQHTIKAD